MLLPSADKLKLLANADAIWAEEVLRERGGSLPADALRTVTLLATGSQDAADDAFARRVLEEERRKTRH